MVHISKGPTYRDFVTILTEGSMQDVTVVRLFSIQEFRLPPPPSIKCNVLRESLSEDSQNNPCATLKRRGVAGYLYRVHLWCPWLKACALESMLLCVRDFSKHEVCEST
jgi:hypothetical protein